MSELVPKHLKRDAVIPEHRQLIKEAIERDLTDELDIIAVFYGGSIGNKNSVNYSDIDLRIVVREDTFEKYRKNKKIRAAMWGNVLFYEDFPHTNYSTAHYDSFVKVDTFYYRLTDILPSIWLKNIEIVFDSSEMLEDIVKKSGTLTFHPSFEDVDLWRTKFFGHLHETYRRVMRGEIYYALDCLDNLRFSMAVAWYMEAGIQPNTFGDWGKIEGSRSELQDWQLVQLAKWGSGRNSDEIMAVVEKIIPEFKRAHKSLCDVVGMNEDAGWVDEVLSKVL